MAVIPTSPNLDKQAVLCLHCLEKQHECRKLHLFTKTLHIALQPNTKHIQIITWLSLNHRSLLVGYVSNSTDASCCQTRCECHFFFFQQQSAWCTQHSSAAYVVQNSQLYPKLWPSCQSWTQLITLRDPLSDTVVKILVLSLQYSKIQQLLVELWETFNAAFTRCDFRVSMFYQVVQTLVWWGGK